MLACSAEVQDIFLRNLSVIMSSGSFPVASLLDTHEQQQQQKKLQS